MVIQTKLDGCNGSCQDGNESFQVTVCTLNIVSQRISNHGLSWVAKLKHSCPFGNPHRGPPTMHHPHKRPFLTSGIFWGVVCELSEPKQKQNTHHPQFCTCDVHLRFGGGSVCISASDLKNAFSKRCKRAVSFSQASAIAMRKWDPWWGFFNKLKGFASFFAAGQTTQNGLPWIARFPIVSSMMKRYQIGNAGLFTKVVFTILVPFSPPPLPKQWSDGFPLEIL